MRDKHPAALLRDPRRGLRALRRTTLSLAAISGEASATEETVVGTPMKKSRIQSLHTKATETTPKKTLRGLLGSVHLARLASSQREQRQTDLETIWTIGSVTREQRAISTLMRAMT